jgi:hypothetical protein
LLVQILLVGFVVLNRRFTDRELCLDSGRRLFRCGIGCIHTQSLFEPCWVGRALAEPPETVERLGLSRFGENPAHLCMSFQTASQILRLATLIIWPEKLSLDIE